MQKWRFKDAKTLKGRTGFAGVGQRKKFGGNC